MNAVERREKIVETLTKSEQPMSATALAKDLGVSRQIIVGDIALLRAGNCEILATPRGYVLGIKAVRAGIKKILACIHTGERLEEELSTIVQCGGGIIDVIVEHPVYGQIFAPLHLFTQKDVAEFARKIEVYDAEPLCALTKGVHLHTVLCPTQEILETVLKELSQKGFLYENP